MLQKVHIKLTVQVAYSNVKPSLIFSVFSLLQIRWARLHIKRSSTTSFNSMDSILRVSPNTRLIFTLNLTLNKTVEQTTPLAA